MIGVSVRTVRRMIATGDVEAVRVGPRLIRVRADTLLNSSRRIGGVA